MAIDNPADTNTPDLTDSPIMPTGSGVVDAEIAHMQSLVTGESGVADETERVSEIVETGPDAGAPRSIHEGDPATTDDGSGTSETD